jgi:thioredoxin:protein disulfide reductase
MMNLYNILRKGRVTSGCLGLIITLLLITGPALALDGSEDPGGFAGPPGIEVRLEILADPPVAGETVPIALIYSVPQGTHMTDAFFTVQFTSDPPLEFGTPVYPAGTMEEGFTVFRGEVPVWTTVTLPESPGDVIFNASADYQICLEGETEMCFPPDLARADLQVAVSRADGDWHLKTVAGVQLADLEQAVDSGSTAIATAEPTDLAGRLKKALDRGSWFAFLMVFLGGVLASLTPCVYPVIPITISFIGGSSKGNPFKGFIISLWFVLGIAITYSVLGLLAAAGGGAFGQATQNGWVNGGIALLIGAMGLSMAGFFDIQLPSSMTSKIGGAKTGFLGPLLMGFATGLIAAPCVGPVLIVLLTWVATTGSLFLGFWLLFVFALGLGMLFIVLGTFSGAITALPGAGAWMDNVKHVFSILLFAMALWFVRSIFPGWLLTGTFGIIVVLGLGAWGAFRPLGEDATHKEGAVKGLLLLLWILGAFLALSGLIRGFAPQLLPAGSPSTQVAAAHLEPDWIWNDDDGFAMAATAGKPVMMDFWAEWCAACNELDHKTYNQPEILALADDFISIKMDMTRKSDENEAILAHYGVKGMPTVIFFTPDGRELERFAGFKKGADMAPYMNRALGR